MLDQYVKLQIILKSFWNLKSNLMTSDLYHQAICESGNELSLWAINEPEQHPELYGEEVARSFDCHILDQDNKTDIDAMVHCLRQVDSSDVVSISPTCSVSRRKQLITRCYGRVETTIYKYFLSCYNDL